MDSLKELNSWRNSGIENVSCDTFDFTFEREPDEEINIDVTIKELRELIRNPTQQEKIILYVKDWVWEYY